MLNLEILSSQKVEPDESPHYSEVTGDRDDHEAGVEAQQQVVDGLRHGLTREQGESDHTTNQFRISRSWLYAICDDVSSGRQMNEVKRIAELSSSQ